MTLVVGRGGASRRTGRSWGRAIASLAAAGYHAVTLDLRGHGESDWAPDGCYDLMGLRDDLLDVLVDLGGRPALVGVSLGGLTSLLTAGKTARPVACWSMTCRRSDPRTGWQSAPSCLPISTVSPLSTKRRTP